APPLVLGGYAGGDARPAEGQAAAPRVQAQEVPIPESEGQVHGGATRATMKRTGVGRTVDIHSGQDLERPVLAIPERGRKNNADVRPAARILIGSTAGDAEAQAAAGPHGPVVQRIRKR